MRIISFNIQLLALAILVISCSNTKTASTKRTYIEFDLVATVKQDSLPSKKWPIYAAVINTNEQLKHILDDDIFPYFDFRNSISDSLFDFGKYDYIISRGYPVDSVSHSEFFTNIMDNCKNKEIIPVEIKCDSVYRDSLFFIYRLKEKNKYRSPCG